jgi:Domain of unknown function (DUF4172)
MILLDDVVEVTPAPHYDGPPSGILVAEESQRAVTRRVAGRMQDLGFDLRREAHLSTLTEDVVRSSEIEGEKLDSDQVKSSIARRLGMDVGGLVLADRDVEGVVGMMPADRCR